MSDYTMKLRDLVKMLLLPKSYISFYDIIENGSPALFNFDFPIFNENYRLTLEKKIISHYYMREIGFETPELFVYHLYSRMNEIMPKYNPLYQAQEKLYGADILNPLNEVEEYNGNKKGDDMSNGSTTDTSTQKANGTNESTINSTSTQNTTNNKDVNTTGSRTNNVTENTLTSDLPQINFSNVDYGTQSNNANTASTENTTEKTTDKTSITDNSTNDTTENGTTSSSTTNDKNSTFDNNRNYSENNTSTRTRKGNSSNKSAGELIIEFQNAVLNIDEMIIADLSILFMSIY